MTSIHDDKPFRADNSMAGLQTPAVPLSACPGGSPPKVVTQCRVLMNNLPYVAMILLGSSIIWAASDTGFWRYVLGGVYAVYGALGAFWIILFVCPYCQLYGTGLCSCGYDRVASRLRPKKDGERFARQFRRHLPLIVPLWFLPLIGGIIGLLGEFSWPFAGILLAFAINSYVILPLVSRQHGSASCSCKRVGP